METNISHLENEHLSQMENKIILILKLEAQTLVQKLIPSFFSKETDLGESKHAQLLQNLVSGKMNCLKTGPSPEFFFLSISFRYWIWKVLVQN